MTTTTSPTPNAPKPNDSAGQPSVASPSKPAKKQTVRRTPEQRAADLKRRLARAQSEEQAMHFRSAATVGFTVLAELREAKIRDRTANVVTKVLVHTTRPADERARDRAVWELLRSLPPADREQVLQDALTKARTTQPGIVDVKPFKVMLPLVAAEEAAKEKTAGG